MVRRTTYSGSVRRPERKRNEPWGVCSVVDAIAREAGSRADAIEEMTDKKSKDYARIAYLDDSEKADKLFENQLKLMKQPVCRNGKNAATVGLAQKTWETWK